jgi:hypothetical protein
MSQENEKVIGEAGNVKFELMPKTLTSPFTDHFPNYTEGLAKGEPGGFVLTPEYARHAEKFLKFQPRNDDVWVVTFPKCGRNCLSSIRKFYIKKRQIMNKFIFQVPHGRRNWCGWW